MCEPPRSEYVLVKPKDSNTASQMATKISTEDCWAEPCVSLWAFGSTGFNCDFNITQTGRRVELDSNQRLTGISIPSSGRLLRHKVVTVDWTYGYVR